MNLDSLPENRMPVIRVPARPADQNPTKNTQDRVSKEKT